MKLFAHRARLPGNVDMITGSALTPVLESVTALPAPAYRQEGGASSRLARERNPSEGDRQERSLLDCLSFDQLNLARHLLSQFEIVSDNH